MKRIAIVICMTAILIAACMPVKSGEEQVNFAAPVYIAKAAPTSPTEVATEATSSTLPSPTPMPQPSLNPETYTVQPGETLGEIAQKFGLPLVFLADINNINNPNRIFQFQVLNLTGTQVFPQPTVVDGKQIIVVLSTQREYAFENGSLIREFIVSTGKASTPTVTGDFKIEVKLVTTRMTDHLTYDIPDVPWTMYFGNREVPWTEGYALHGAPWNHDLGTPHSHGCVNMDVDDALWLFDWAPKGTPVHIIQ